MKRTCTALGRILAAVMLMTFAGIVAGQPSYPTKPIHIVVAYPPGGGNDILARMVGQKLSESWGQPVIIDNRPGGNSVIGTDLVAKAPADGYTLLSTGGGLATTSLLLRTPYDPMKDFAPVATVSKSEYILVSNPGLPLSNLQDLIALAKAKPGALNYASAGSGTGPHFAGEMLNAAAGVKFQHIPYKGGTLAVADVIGGQVEISIQPAIFFIAHIRSGKLKGLAITGETRSPMVPQVPTFSEAGLPSFDIKSWFAFATTAGTPRPVIDKLNAEIAKILAMSDIKEKLISQGMDPFVSTPEQIVALMNSDVAKYTKIIKSANIKMED
jgi:tripartite-type tricarboxylate transporter receptor subunit TctC